MTRQPSVTPNSTSKKPRRWRPVHSLVVRPRFSLSMLVSLISFGVLLVCQVRLVQAFLLGFDIGALVFLASIWRMFNRTSQDGMQRMAKVQDAGRRGIMLISMGLPAIVLIALGSELHASKAGGVGALVVSASTIVLAWLFMNVMYALHYAHGFYGDYGDQHKGLDFPGTDEPDYWDFTYFSVILGMTFQVSDVSITSRHLRRVAMVHSLIAFFFNMFIIALSVNIVAGQA